MRYLCVKRQHCVTFFKSLWYLHWFYFGQISRVEVIEKHEATADNVLGCARHDASESYVYCGIGARETDDDDDDEFVHVVSSYAACGKRKAGQSLRFLRHDRARSSATASRSFPLSESARSDGSLGRSYDLYLHHTHTDVVRESPSAALNAVMRPP